MRAFAIALILCTVGAMGRPNKDPSIHADAMRMLRGRDFRVPRQACDEEAFLTSIGGNCRTDYSAVRAAFLAVDTRDATDSQLEALRNFCDFCAQRFADFQDDECGDEVFADEIRERCSLSPDLRFCGEHRLRIRETDSEYNLTSFCSSACTTECRASIEEATDDLGCCLATFSDSDTVRAIWDQCNLDLPEGCVDEDEDDDDDDDDLSDAVLGVIIGLPTVVLVGAGAFITGIAVYYCFCRNSK